MVMNSSDIQKGMEVYGTDGDKIGSVSHVFPNAGTGMDGAGTDTAPTGNTGWGSDSTSSPEEVVVEQVSIVETVPDYGAQEINAGGAGSGSSDMANAGQSSWGSSGGSTPSSAAQPFSGTSSSAAATMTATGYFEVDQGGILGIGTKHLYIPFSAVTDIALGDCLTVNCTKDECDNLYSTKPDFLDNNDSGTW